MNKIILYHGSCNEYFIPKYGLGNEKHDYGKGFYLTNDLELAKEWAVSNPNSLNGYVHKYELDLSNLNVLDFGQLNILSWLAELMKHRPASTSKRYTILAQKFINIYGVDTSKYDVIKGWRADASYFYIAKEFVRDNIDIDILNELLSLGNLGIQYCLKTPKAYENLVEIYDDLEVVNYCEFNPKYNNRDINAREKMYELINSDRNEVKNVFSSLMEDSK